MRQMVGYVFFEQLSDTIRHGGRTVIKKAIHSLQHACYCYLCQRGITFMTICLSVLSVFSKDYANTTICKKSEDSSWSNLDPFKF